MAETIDLSTTTSIEALNALIIAAEQRREELQRFNFSQLRQNLKAVAKDLGVPLSELLRRLAANDTGEAPVRSRRPSDVVRAAKREAAKKLKYYDPVSGTGWSGMGRAPRAFRDKDSGQVDEKFLRACRNPDYQEWAAE